MVQFGILSLVPALSVLLLALFTRRTLEALIGGALIGFVIWKQEAFFSSFVDASLKVLGDKTIGWIILVCGMFGSLITLLVKSGGALAFGETLSRHVKSKPGSMVATWFLGLVIFIDDYLSALTVSSAMKKVTDKYGVSREMLSYIVDSTAAPMCVLVPFSTWAIFVAGLLESSKAAETGGGMTLYLSAVPFMFYAWVALIIVPLAALRVIPPLGAMRAAERRAEAGKPIPPGAPLSEVHGDALAAGAHGKVRVFNFLFPIFTLIAATWYFDVDALKGVFVALAVTIVLLAVQKIMSLGEIFDSMLEGFKTMILPLGIVAASFVLKEVNDGLGLTQYVIDLVRPMMSAKLLPAVAFFSLSLVTFSTGSFWGVYAVAFPVMIPLAHALGANLPLTVGAVVSAGAFGSHACFFGDASVLSAVGSGCSAAEHNITQAPYAALGAATAGLMFLAAGMML